MFTCSIAYMAAKNSLYIVDLFGRQQFRVQFHLSASQEMKANKENTLMKEISLHDE